MTHRGQSTKLAIEIKGKTVSFTVDCQDDYEAMMFYDKLGEQLRTGHVKLEFAAPGHLIEGDPS